MSDSPSTFRGEPSDFSAIEWDHSAELHQREDGSGVAHRFKTIRRGTFAELIGFVMGMPESRQHDYSIEKAGDRRYEIGEIRMLFQRDDFPGSKGA